MSFILLVVKTLTGLAVGVYLLVCAYLYFNQAQFLFPGAYAPAPPRLDEIGRAIGLESAAVPAADGTRLFALHHAPQAGRPLVIVFHGNASYPESYAFLFEGWLAAGYGVVAPAQRGYPRSEGKAEGERMLSDALDIHDWAVRTYPGHPVIVFGQSLGTAPAVHMAAKRDVAGMVLISPFASMLSLVRERFPWLPIGLLLKSPLRSDLAMPDVKAPVLIVHGENDTLVPIASGRALAALARTKVDFEATPGAGHNDGLFEPATIARIAAFMARLQP